MFLQKLTENTVALADMQISGTETASVVITGFAVVFAALILLVICISIFGRIFDSIANTKKNKVKLEKPAATIQTVTKAPVITGNAASTEIQDGIDDEVIAVISAAIAAISSSTGSGYAIKSIKRSVNNVNRWAAAGLLDNTRPF